MKMTDFLLLEAISKDYWDKGIKIMGRLVPFQSSWIKNL
jgi:hypothetical protein